MHLKRLAILFLFPLVLSLTGCERVLRRLARENEDDHALELRNVLWAEVRLPEMSREATAQVSQLLAQAASVPGVEQVAVVDVLPDAATRLQHTWIEREGTPSRPGPAGQVRCVSEGYFATLGIPLYRGRFFSVRDDERSEPMAIINASYARQRNSTSDGRVSQTDPLGERVRIEQYPWPLTIVGMVGDRPHSGDTPELFVLYRQHHLFGPRGSSAEPSSAPPWYLLARVDGEPEAVAARLQRVLPWEFRSLGDRRAD